MIKPPKIKETNCLSKKRKSNSCDDDENKNPKGEKKLEDQSIHNEGGSTSSTISTVKDITQTKQQDEATSSSSTVLLSVPNKRLPCKAQSKVSETNNENYNPEHDNSTISSLRPSNSIPTKEQQQRQPQILKVQNEPSNKAPPPRHHSLPTEIPIIKNIGPFASPLSTGSISTVDSPSPKEPSTRKSKWFQKKRRKLKQTTLNFAL